MPVTPGQRGGPESLEGRVGSWEAGNPWGSPPRLVYERGVCVQPQAGERGGGVVDDERAQVGPRAPQHQAVARASQSKSVLRLPHPRDLARGAPHAADALQRQAVAHLPHVPQDERGEVLVRLERRALLERHSVRALVVCLVLWLFVSGGWSGSRNAEERSDLRFKIKREIESSLSPCFCLRRRETT